VVVTKSGYVTNNTHQITAVAGTSPADEAIQVEQLPRATITVTSKLGSASATNVTDATVKLTPTGGGSAITATRDTSGNGNTYVVDGLTPDHYDVAVTGAVNNEDDTTTLTNVNIVAGADYAGSVQLKAYSTVTVLATTQAGAAVPFDAKSPLTTGTATGDAKVGGADFTATYDSTSGGAGVWKATNVVPGTYDITIALTHYTSVVLNDVVIAAGTNHADLTAALVAKTGGISGVVSDAFDGLALPGVTATATAVISGVEDASTLQTFTPTLADGKYTFTGLAPSTWKVHFTLTNYGPIETTVVVNPETTETLNQALAQIGANITGTVEGIATNDVAADGTTNPQAALADVAVALTRSGATPMNFVTGADGKFSFSSVHSGDWTITFTHNGYVTRSRTISNVPATGALGLTGDVLVATEGTVNVTVRDSVTNLPLDGVNVRLAGDRIASPGYIGTVSGTATPNSGIASFANVPPGSYDVVVHSTPSGYTLSAATHPVTLAISTTTAAPTAALDPLNVAPQGTLAVKVLGYDGAGLNNATVVVTHPGGTATGNSGVGGTGNVSVPDLDAGSANFVVSATGYDDSASIPITITPGATATAANVTLTASTVTLTVTVNGEGTQLSDTSTLVGLYDGPGLVATMDTTTGGKAVFTGVLPKSPSTYTLNALSPGYTTQTGVAVTVGLGPSGSTKTVNLLAAPITMSGVTIAGLLGSEATTVTVKDTNGNTIGTGNRTGNGTIGAFSINIAGLGASPNVKVSVSTVTNYDTPLTITVPVTIGVNDVGVHTLTYAPTPIDLDVHFTGDSVKTKTVTFDGGAAGGSHSDVVAGSESATVTNLVPGVLYTITVPGKTVTPNNYTPSLGTNPTLNLVAGP
jgi:hypothetical protein